MTDLDNNESGDLTPRLLLTGAVGFWHAARGLLDVEKAGQFYWPAFYVNIGYAIELSLKAYLLEKGETISQLKSIGHKLNDALKRAEKQDFVVYDIEAEKLINWLDKFHSEHTFRYLKRQTYSFPNAFDDKDILGISDAFIRSTYEQISV